MRKQILHIFFTFILGIYLSISLYSQNETGNPFITNYYAEDYKGHTQNFSVIQDERGLIYFANGNGIIVYDGDSWEMINIPKDLMVRDLAIDRNGLIYAASNNELGYLQPNDQGKTKYISLRDSVNIEGNFGIIREIIQIDEKIYFRSTNYLICLDKNGFNHWKAKTSFDLSFKYNNDIYIYEEKNGLFILKNDELVIAPGGEKIIGYTFKTANQIEDKIVFINNNYGLFIYKVFDQSDAEFKYLDCEANEFIIKNKVYRSEVYNNKLIIATNNGGCLLTNIYGEILNIINIESGLQSNNVNGIYIDNSENLWLALNKGIAKCNISLPITFWNETNGLKGIVLNIIRFNDILYIATHQGVYYLKERKAVKINAQVSSSWSFLKYNDIKRNKEYLLLCTQEGIFSVKKDKIIQLAEINGAVTLYQSELHPEIVYFGATNDIGILKFSEGTFTFKGMIPGTGISVRSIKEEKNGDIWISSFRHDLIKLIPSGDPLNPKKIIKYNTDNGLPSLKNILIYEFKNETVFATEQGLYRYNSETNSFIPEETFKDIFSGKEKDIFSFNETDSGNVWISQLNNKKGSVGYAALNSNGTYTWNSELFNIIPEMMVLAIYPEEDGSIWIGGSEGLFHYDPSIEKKYNSLVKTFIRKVIINSDSIIFYGNYYENRENKQYFSSKQNENLIFNLSFKYNSITFHYATPDFIDESSTEYQFFLEGFDNNWSDWSLNTKKEYTNLPEGNYIFKVKAKNIYSIISETARYKFTVYPPWYRTIAAYAAYFVLSVIFIGLIVRLSIKRLKNLNIELESQIEKRTSEINIQKGEILAQSDELERKNIELKKHRNQLEQLVRERTSELVTAKEKAEESDRLKSAFLANMSHEIRTPMNAIMGFSNLLNDKEFDKKKRKELIAYIIRGSNTLLHLINDIIDISKIEAGQLEIIKENCFINIIFDELFSIYEEKNISDLKKKIEIKFIKKEDEEIILFTDSFRLQQVLVNLIDNALKFTETGFVEIGYSIKESVNKNEIIFYIKDTGIGLTKQQQNKIFSRFTKLENEREKLYRGAGLGLSICKNIIELLSGEIWLDSELNKGSTFYFSIPYNRDIQSKKEKHTIAQVVKNYNLSDKTLLIAEDEISNFKLLKMFLSETNIKIIHAKNGNEVYEKYKKEKIDLILMDIKMPISDGLKTTKKIRLENPNIPIIAQTAFAMENDKNMCINTGCNDYITKPVNKQKLLGLIYKYLS